MVASVIGRCARGRARGGRYYTGLVPCPRHPLALADTLPVRGPQPRILIVRLSALGDIVFATALLEGLRAAYPRAHIAWLAQPGFGAILEQDPRLDELIRVPAEALRSPLALARLRGELTRRRFDWVIEAQGLAKSRAVAALAGGATRIGFESKEPLALLMHHRLPKGGDIRDVSSEYRYLAEAITGVPAPPPRLRVSETARAAAIAALAAQGLAAGYVALCPFTTRPQKHWMEAYWPDLAQRLGQALGRPCAIFGGPADTAAAARIAAQAGGAAADLAGRTRVAELPAWLEQAGLVIGVDTGLTHMGIALRRPTVALFGSTCPYTRGADSPLRVIYDALPCAPCKRNPSCGGSFDCLRGISPARVHQTALQLLATAA